MIGLIIYFINNPIISAYVYKVTDVAYLDMENPRLGSFSVMNSINASFYLIFANGIIIYRLSKKFNSLDLSLLLIGIVAIIYTWSRSGWIFQVSLILLYFYYAGKLKISSILKLAIIALPLFIFLNQTINKRIQTDKRLSSSENYETRLYLIQEYASKISNIPFFGLTEKTENAIKKLKVNTDISSENIILDAFTTRGIIGGLLVIYLFLYFLVSFISLRKLSYKLKEYDPDLNLFVIMISSIFIILFLFSNTFVLQYTDPIWWLLFATAVILKRNFKNTQALDN